MLNPTQARVLHEQIMAAYFDDSEESLEVFEDLVAQATEHMSECDWTALCLAIGADPTDPPALQTRRITIKLEVKLAACWIGANVQRQGQARHIWICVLPCLPIHLTINIRTVERKPRDDR